jgi:predicted alpha/beta superfamily hydrolase
MQHRSVVALGLLALLCLTSAGAVPHTVAGRLDLHEINSTNLRQRRTIRIWLPPAYERNQDARYPVLYMQDGQNCFDRATSAFGNEWQIDETLTRLIADTIVPPIIVVGIDNGSTNRLNELTYDHDPKYGGGQGAVYAKFLLEEVKPYVESTYRVKAGKPFTYIGGSSLGGLISLEIARRHPDVFGGIIAMSPSLWWDGQALDELIEQDASAYTGDRIWLDTGTTEVPSVSESLLVADAIRRMDRALARHGIEHHVMIEEGAPHNEISWARRFPLAIRYILDPSVVAP